MPKGAILSTNIILTRRRRQHEVEWQGLDPTAYVRWWAHLNVKYHIWIESLCKQMVLEKSWLLGTAFDCRRQFRRTNFGPLTWPVGSDAIKYKGWVATLFLVARTHTALPDSLPHTHVCAHWFWSGRTPHPHTAPAPTIPIWIQSKFVKTKAREKSNNFFLHFFEIMSKDD